MYILSVEYHNERKTIIYKTNDDYFKGEFKKIWGVALIRKQDNCDGFRDLVLNEIAISFGEFNCFKEMVRSGTFVCRSFEKTFYVTYQVNHLGN